MSKHRVQHDAPAPAPPVASKPDDIVGQMVWFFEHTENGGRYEHIARVEELLPDGAAILSFLRSGDHERTRTAPIAERKAGAVGSAWVRR